MADQDQTAQEKATALVERRQGKQTAALTVKDLLEQAMPQIRRAVPKHVTPERLARVALTTIGRDSKLLRCTPVSLVKAVLEAASYGLEPTGVLGHAALVPYGQEVQLQIMYRGYMDLAYRSGKVESIDAEVVRDGEVFECEYGSNKHLKHIPGDDDEAKVVKVYAHATMVGGGEQFVVLGLKQIEQARRASKSGGSGPWANYPEEMMKKTAIRRLAKRLPLSPEMMTAATVEEAREAGVPVPAATDVDFTETAEPEREPGQEG